MLAALAYLFSFLIGVAVTLSGRPLIGLLVYLQTFYVYSPGYWWGRKLPNLRWSLVAAIVTFLAVKIKDSKSSNSAEPEAGDLIAKPGFFSLPENTLYLFFVLWIWLQSLWAIDPVSHKVYAVMVSKFLLLLYLIHKILIDRKSIFVFVIANTLGCGYFGWYADANFEGKGRLEQVVPTPGLSDANGFCLHMAPVLVISSFVLLCDFTKKKYWLVIPIVMILNGIFLAQSRGALLGMAVASLLVFAFRPYRLRKQIYFYMLLGAVAAVNLIPADFLDRIYRAADAGEAGRDESAESRIFIVIAQWEMFKTSPLLGYGHKGTRALSPLYLEGWLSTEQGGEARRASHNMLMSLLVDHSIVGTTVYLTIIFIYFKRLLFMRKRLLLMEHGNLSILYIAGTAALLVLCVASMTSNSLRHETGILLFGMLTAIFCLIKPKLASPIVKGSTPTPGSRNQAE